MDQIKEFLTRKNIIVFLIIAILAAGLLVGLRLVQQQQQLKSQAAEEGFACNASKDEFRYCMWFSSTRDGEAITAGKEVWVWVVGGQDDLSPGLEGTVKLSAALESGPGVNCYQGETFKNCWKFVIPASQVTNKTYTETFKSELAPGGRVASSFTPQAPPSSPSPTPAEKVTIGGRVTRSDKSGNDAGISGVVINQNAISPTNCNIGTATTDSNGGYRFIVTKGTLFCLRPPQDSSRNPIVPISGVIVPAVPSSYENLTATADKTDFDFVYNPSSPPAPVPSDQAACGSITIDGQDLGLATQTVSPGSRHTIEIIMRNPPSDSKATSKSWESDYSLKFTSGTQTANALGLNPTSVPLTAKVEPQKTFEFGNSITITPPSTTISGNYNFVWQMHNGSGTPFGGECKRQITVGSVGGPSPSPTPALCGECGTPTSGVSCDVSWTDNNSICRAKGSTHRNDKCVEKICYPPSALGQCGTCWGPTGSKECTFDSNKCPPVEDPSKTICVVSGARRGDCVAQATPTPTPTPGGGFDFSINKPSDFIMAKGQAQVGKEFATSKTAGSAEDVTFAVSGNTGGAVAVFSPSGVCKPDPSVCRRTLTFTTANADPGDYSITIQGISTGGRIRESDPFNLKINPAQPIVTCFVVSENRNTRNLFKDCAPSTISNVSGGIAGTIEDLPQLLDFQLSAQNGNKTLYARFLKLPVGEPIETCSADKCRDTQAGISLAAIVPVTPPPTPPPVTNCICQTDDTCSAPCQFTKLTGIKYGYPFGGPISCLTPVGMHNISPSSANKNSYCNRPRRTEGDANADNKIDIDDYLYYLTAVSRGKVPVGVDPDFNGNGDVGLDDLEIWERSTKP